MSLELTKQQTDDAVASLRRYFRQELEQELPEMQARFLLELPVQCLERLVSLCHGLGPPLESRIVNRES